jgi:hypothetical protein
MKELLKLLANVLILAICCFSAALLSGRFVSTEHRIDNVDVATLGAQRAAALIAQGKKVEATTIVDVGGRPYRIGGDWNGLWPVLAALGLVVVYLPGLPWPAARGAAVRIGLALAWLMGAAVLSVA